MRKLFFSLTVLLMAAALAPAARADSITYTYTGNLFNALAGGYTCTGVGEGGIQGSFTLDGPLAANMNYSPAAPLSFDFTDGSFEFTQANSPSSSFYMQTDASGVITDWNINLYSLGTAGLVPSAATHGPGPAEDLGFTSQTGFVG